jgi:polar amino acid transport system substrate-binding protein
MVGFNRRFSPFAEEIKSFFQNRTQPLAINYRINAGFAAKDHWIQKPDEGGGRIVGEVCHFLDLMQFITGSDPLRVFAESISANNNAVSDSDNVSITIKYRDGSLGTIFYVANGDSSLPKEQIEVFGESSVTVVNDFKKVQLIRKGRTRTVRRYKQDKGHRKELQAFIDAVKDDNGVPIPFKDIVTATFLTFMIKRSLRDQLPLDIDLGQLGL